MNTSWASFVRHGFRQPDCGLRIADCGFPVPRPGERIEHRDAVGDMVAPELREIEGGCVVVPVRPAFDTGEGDRSPAQVPLAPIRNPQSAIRNSSEAAGRRGMVLLEVVLAMAIFFAAALVILAGLSSSVRGVQRVQWEAQAQDLAVSLLSEVQMGLVPLVSDGPTDYEEPDLAGWAWQIVVEPYDEPQAGLELPEFSRVEVIVRHESGCSTKLSTLMTEQQVENVTEGAGP